MVTISPCRPEAVAPLSQWSGTLHLREAHWRHPAAATSTGSNGSGEPRGRRRSPGAPCYQLLAFMPTLVSNSGLCNRRLLIGGSPFSGACVNYVGGSIRSWRESEDLWANKPAENSVKLDSYTSPLSDRLALLLLSTISLVCKPSRPYGLVISRDPKG